MLFFCLPYSGKSSYCNKACDPVYKDIEHILARGSNFAGFGGDKEIRTPDLCIANASLYQLSHIPTQRMYYIVLVSGGQVFVRCFLNFDYIFLKTFLICVETIILYFYRSIGQKERLFCLRQVLFGLRRIGHSFHFETIPMGLAHL